MEEASWRIVIIIVIKIKIIVILILLIIIIKLIEWIIRIIRITIKLWLII